MEVINNLLFPTANSGALQKEGNDIVQELDRLLNPPNNQLPYQKNLQWQLLLVSCALFFVGYQTMKMGAATFIAEARKTMRRHYAIQVWHVSGRGKCQGSMSEERDAQFLQKLWQNPDWESRTLSHVRETDGDPSSERKTVYRNRTLK